MLTLADDSGSMQFDEDGERIKDLKLILSRVAYAASLFDTDGVSLRFMNFDPHDPDNPQRREVPPESLDSIRTEEQIEWLVSKIKFKGLTPMGTELRNKILEPMVLDHARRNSLAKPVLIITITDGQPAGEPSGTLFEVIRNASAELSRMPHYGRGALSFQFAQVGNDKQAEAFLKKLDNEPTIGNIVDCTSSTYQNLPISSNR